VQFVFGPFTLDVDTRQLRRGGDGIHLSPKAFELLKTLVEVRPRALTKAELHESLWPHTFVSDANLAVLIAEIRRALDDDARKSALVRTVHGFGYAFSGKAIEVPSALREPSPAGVSHWLIWRKRKFRLAEGSNLAGRSPEATIWIDVPGVSREHARITIKRDGATLEDLGSRNGTFHTGARIGGPVPLHDGDRIQFGPVQVTFRVWVPGAGSKTQDLSAAKTTAS
jgi:DNA-binding winged helix-turn-helix (wHTH) protein